jgi:hypothetical protein
LYSIGGKGQTQIRFLKDSWQTTPNWLPEVEFFLLSGLQLNLRPQSKYQFPFLFFLQKRLGNGFEFVDGNRSAPEDTL